MELYQEILAHILKSEEIQVTFPGLKQNGAEIVESVSYQALQKIKAVIEDDSLDDPTCYMKIEEIVRVIEELGSHGGNRHDFG